MQDWSHGSAGDGSPSVLVLPGARYGARMPGLAWPIRALELGGWRVSCAAWDMPMGQPDDERRGLVQAALDRFVDRSGAVPDLVLAKSVGTFAAGWVADHDVPAVWTTPLLDDEACVRDLARSGVPALLVAGERDFTWDDDGARRTGAEVVRVPAADHGWRTGQWRTELDALALLTSAVERFAGGLVRRPAGVPESVPSAGEAR